MLDFASEIFFFAFAAYSIFSIISIKLKAANDKLQATTKRISRYYKTRINRAATIRRLEQREVFTPTARSKEALTLQTHKPLRRTQTLPRLLSSGPTGTGATEVPLRVTSRKELKSFSDLMQASTFHYKRKKKSDDHKDFEENSLHGMTFHCKEKQKSHEPKNFEENSLILSPDVQASIVPNFDRFLSPISSMKDEKGFLLNITPRDSFMTADPRASNTMSSPHRSFVKEIDTHREQS